MQDRQGGSSDDDWQCLPLRRGGALPEVRALPGACDRSSGATLQTSTCSAAMASGGCGTVSAGAPTLKMPAFSRAISCSTIYLSATKTARPAPVITSPDLVLQGRQSTLWVQDAVPTSCQAFCRDPCQQRCPDTSWTEGTVYSSKTHRQGVPQHVHVVKAERGDTAHHGRPHAVGSVQPAAQPHLHDRHVHALLQKRPQRCAGDMNVSISRHWNNVVE